MDQVKTFILTNPNFLNQNSMVHCYAGISRSSAIALFTMLLLKKDLEKSIKTLRARRPFIRPNLDVASLIENYGYKDVRKTLEETFDYTRIY